MAASKVQMNFTGVSFGGTSITRVMQISLDLGGELIFFGGDNDRYATVVANNFNRPRVSITSGDVAVLMSLTAGQSGTLTFTQLDAVGASGGNILWTVVNCVHGTSINNAPFSQFATGQAEFATWSPDGSTNPMSFTRA